MPNLSALFIILVGLMMTLFSDEMLISNRCIRGLMPNMIKKSWMVSSTYVVRVSKGGKKNYYYEWGEKHLSLGTHKLGACKTMSNDNSKKIPCLPKRITFSFSHKKEIRCSSNLGLPLVWHCHLKMQIKSCSLVYLYNIFRITNL